MTDHGGNSVTMNSSSAKSEDDDKSWETKRNRDILMFKKILSFQTHYSEALIVQILRTLAASEEIGDERVLLGSVTLATVLLNDFSSEKLSEEYKKYLSLETPSLLTFDENFKIRDLEWFKIVIAHGFFQVNNDDVSSAFEILYKYCLAYTKYSYIAYKVLYLWLDKKSKARFWLDSDTSEIESKLEAIIFSNWDNCISEITRWSTTQIFPAYLKIMIAKYDGYLEMIFEKCMQHLSWQNVTKYEILVEIFKISDSLTLVDSRLTSGVFTSLTKNDLKRAGTQLYSVILKKMNFDDWQEKFGRDFFRILNCWESQNELVSIDLLWDQWMKPTLQKFPNIFWHLWEHPAMRKLKFSKMHLEKLGDQQQFELIYEDADIREIVNTRIVDISETVRLNAFAIICQCNNWKIDVSEDDAFVTAKRFLYFNATASSITMRKGIIENFKVLLDNVVRKANEDSAVDRQACNFFEWLHTFFMDCFEIGSTYQQKILGLNLYGIVLNFTSDDFAKGASLKTKKYATTLKSAKDLKSRMMEKERWKYVDRRSGLTLLKLVIDEMSDVSETSTSILRCYFDSKVFTKEELEVIKDEAIRLSKSSRFHEVTGGSALFSILISWQRIIPSHQEYRFMFNCIYAQLRSMKLDILKSVMEGFVFYGTLTMMFHISQHISYHDEQAEEFLSLLNEATQFFISVLSVDDTEFSSSFKDMDIAIDEKIRESKVYVGSEENAVLSAHQLLISCIWMSLKVSCDMATHMAFKKTSQKTVNAALSVITDVLLKCRHKGAIEAAGVALSKLTRYLCIIGYEGTVSQLLLDLLKVGENENINLTRRGAGLTIMFHRIVSSDDRQNRPMFHLAINELLKTFESRADTQNDDCKKDSTRARHLHFLRSLVADKALQAQLVQYMEEICFVCFDHLQSSEWTVRNASLQLFGAIVPRLVGQCSPKELDYGIGNSIDHFVTHYSKLASCVLEELEDFASTIDRGERSGLANFSSVNKIVPMLTLLSKMSCGGCELIDHSSGDYIARGKKIFSKFLANPVFHVRATAAKAYAAFVPFSELRRELTVIKMRKVHWQCNNYNHGQLLVQYYLQRKYNYEMKSTCDESTIRKHELYEKAFETASRMQIERASYCYKKEFYTLFGPRSDSSMIHNLSSFPVSALLFDCLTNCPVTLNIARSERILENLDGQEYSFLSQLFSKKMGTPPMIGLPEFSEKVIAFNGQLLSCPCVRSFYATHAKSADFWAIFANRDNFASEDSQMKFLIEHAERAEVLAGDDCLLHELSTILEIVKRRPVDSIELERCLSLWDNRLNNFEEEERLKSKRLLIVKRVRNVIYKLKMEMFDAFVTDALEPCVVAHVKEIFNDKEIDAKLEFMDCFFVLVNKLFDNEAILSPERNKNDIVEFVTILLMSEDINAREMCSEKLVSLTRTLVGKFTDPICSRANVHKLWKMLSYPERETSAIDEKTPSLIFNKSTEEFCGIIKFILTKMEENVREETTIPRPYEEEESFKSDETGLLNLLYYSLKSRERVPSTNNEEIVELEQIDGKMLAKYEIQGCAKMNLEDVESYLVLSTARYLSQKRLVLKKLLFVLFKDIFK